MRIRPAQPDDLPRLMELTREAFGPSAWSEALMRDILDAARQRPWLQVARVLELEYTPPLAGSFGGEAIGVDSPAAHAELPLWLAGYLIMQIVGMDAEIQSLAVDPRWQRHGFGHALLADSLSLAVNRRLHRLFLEVRASNLAAQQFYLHRGFEIYGRRTRYYHSPVEDALLMRRPVAPRAG